MESAEAIDSENTELRFKDNLSVVKMYYDSAYLIKGFEDSIITGKYKDVDLDYWERFNNNAIKVENKEFVQRILHDVEKQMKGRKSSNHSNLFKVYFGYLLKAITAYQDEIIEVNFIKFKDNNSYKLYDREQTFLSYAYDDKGLAMALFIYFWIRLGFLYVDWMWNGVNSNSSITKRVLEDALDSSNQLLFLRTINSELRIRGNHNIRQWCSWEIGNFYTKHSDEKYYTNFFETAGTNNDILHTFKPMNFVANGVIH